MDVPIQNILVPIDLSQPALNAARTAAAMCRRQGARLHLLYICPPDGTGPENNDAVVGRSQADLADRLSHLGHTLAISNGIRFSASMAKACSAKVICAKAAELDCDLIIIGTEPDKDKKYYLSTSIAFQVIEQTQIPVLTVPSGRSFDAFNTVLFPVRPVKNNFEKFRFVRNIVAKNDADLYLFSLLQTHDREQQNMFGELLQTIKTARNRKKVYLSRKHVVGSPSSRVLREARQLSADLVVITASSARTVKERILGNYTQNLIHNVSTAVLSIKATDAGIIRDNFEDEPGLFF